MTYKEGCRTKEVLLIGLRLITPTHQHDLLFGIIFASFFRSIFGWIFNGFWLHFWFIFQSAAPLGCRAFQTILITGIIRYLPPPLPPGTAKTPTQNPSKMQYWTTFSVSIFNIIFGMPFFHHFCSRNRFSMHTWVLCGSLFEL